VECGWNLKLRRSIVNLKPRERNGSPLAISSVKEGKKRGKRGKVKGKASPALALIGPRCCPLNQSIRWMVLFFTSYHGIPLKFLHEVLFLCLMTLITTPDII
jgi:hypothetical protein